VLKGASVVVDVSNSPSFDEDVAINFFNTATRNLIRYEQAAGVRTMLRGLSLNRSVSPKKETVRWRKDDSRILRAKLCRRS